MHCTFNQNVAESRLAFCNIYYRRHLEQGKELTLERKTLTTAAGPYIAVFDSGVGGLTVLAELRKQYPNNSFLYLGDTARVPYGTKSPVMVTRYALEAAWFLSRYPLECFVIACNTVSAVALPALRAAHPDIPILEVVTPGALSAVEATQNKQILVLGTEGTIASGAYQKAIHALDPEIEVYGVACPLFVPLAEEGIVSGPIVKMTVQMYLEPFLKKEIDTIVLGCTHYPLLRNAIQEAVGENVKVVDSVAPLTKRLRSHLIHTIEGRPRLRIFVTDHSDRFMRIGRRFLDGNLDEPTQIDLEEMFYENQRLINEPPSLSV